MLSYKIPATVTLLKSKLEVAQTSLDNTIEDLDSEFLMEQLTVMEVNTARVTDGMRNGEGSCERQGNISFPRFPCQYFSSCPCFSQFFNV